MKNVCTSKTRIYLEGRDVVYWKIEGDSAYESLEQEISSYPRCDKRMHTSCTPFWARSDEKGIEVNNAYEIITESQQHEVWSLKKPYPPRSDERRPPVFHKQRSRLCHCLKTCLSMIKKKNGDIERSLIF